MIKDLDFCDQRTFPLLYAFKQENDAAQLELGHEVAADFIKSKGNLKLFEESEKMNR